MSQEPTIIARAGEIVTRYKSGVYVCTVAEDLVANEAARPDQFKDWAEGVCVPEPYTPIQIDADDPWLRWDGHPRWGRVLNIHVGGEWRPRSPLLTAR